MQIAYFDCFAGASGDMILGSLMDVGLELDQLKAELAKLHLTHYDLQMKKVVKKGIGGCQVEICDYNFIKIAVKGKITSGLFANSSGST